MKRTLLSLLMLTLGFGLSCGSDDDDDDSGGGSGNSLDLSGDLPARNQCFAVVGGVDTLAFPGAVLLFRSVNGAVVSRCSGTFVGHNTVITAAHCVGSGATGDVSFAKEDCSANTTELIASTDVFHHGLTADDFSAAAAAQSIDYDLIAQDLAILLFPDDTWDETTSVAETAPEEGDEVTMVGYGIDKTIDDAAASDSVGFAQITKRTGTNTLIDAADTDSPSRVFSVVRNRSETADSPAGEDSIVSTGDSGGPLLFDNQIVGVASTAGVLSNSANEIIDQSLWVSLLFEDSEVLMEEAVAAGANIAGF